MKIARLTVWRLDLPLTGSYDFSGGTQRVERLDSTVLRIETDDGLEGWGEACPWGPGYLPSQHGPGIRAALETLAPVILGCDPRAPEAVGRAMARAAPGHQGARSAVDIACWDVLGKATGQPLWRLLGAEAPAPVALNSSIPTADPDAMRAAFAAHAAAGYRTHSAKIGGGDPDADVARIEAVMAALPEGHAVTFDVNCAWTPGVAVEVPLTSHATYYMAEGKTCDTVETVVIALETDAGLTGWGEVCPIPHYLPAYARGVARPCRSLRP
jgi:L-alanine-DL-glutamate epimerase-like enolase superfamily enzyme